MQPFTHGDDSAAIHGEGKNAPLVLTEFNRPIWERVNTLGVPGVLASSPVEVGVATSEQLGFGGGLMSCPS